MTEGEVQTSKLSLMRYVSRIAFTAALGVQCATPDYSRLLRVLIFVM